MLVFIYTAKTRWSTDGNCFFSKEWKCEVASSDEKVVNLSPVEKFLKKIKMEIKIYLDPILTVEYVLSRKRLISDI